MEVSTLKAMGLPALQSMLSQHKELITKAMFASKSKPVYYKLDVMHKSITNEHRVAGFSFSKENIPFEFINAMHDYSTRLIAEQWLIEEAIEQLNTQVLAHGK
jgi:hypothetical protein